MTDSKQIWNMDIRIRERSLKAGRITAADIDKYMKQLPDLQENVEPVTISQPAAASAAEGHIIPSAGRDKPTVAGAQSIASDEDM